MSTNETTSAPAEAKAETSTLEETLRDIVKRLEAIESSVWQHRVYVTKRDNQEGAQVLDYLDRILQIQANTSTVLGLLAQLMASRGGEPSPDGDGERHPTVARAA